MLPTSVRYTGLLIVNSGTRDPWSSDCQLERIGVLLALARYRHLQALIECLPGTKILLSLSVSISFDISLPLEVMSPVVCPVASDSCAVDRIQNLTLDRRALGTFASLSETWHSPIFRRFNFPFLSRRRPSLTPPNLVSRISTLPRNHISSWFRTSLHASTVPYTTARVPELP